MKSDTPKEPFFDESEHELIKLSTKFNKAVVITERDKRYGVHTKHTNGDHSKRSQKGKNKDRSEDDNSKDGEDDEEEEDEEKENTKEEIKDVLIAALLKEKFLGDDLIALLKEKLILRDDLIALLKDKLVLDDFVALLKEKLISKDESSEIIPRSPMRTTEHPNSWKPYGHPRSICSRTVDGSTRVIEPLHGEVEANNVNIQDVSQWINSCQQDPYRLDQFIQMIGIQEFRSNLGEPRLEPQTYRTNRRSICSSTSSHTSSPAQSPSDRNIASPESAYEENSFFSPSHDPASPNISHFRPNNFTSNDIDNILKKPPSPKEEEEILDELKDLDNMSNLNIFPTSGHNNKVSKSPYAGGVSSPNIGTVMLNLATADAYESNIDLTKFANVCENNYSPEKDYLNERLDPKIKENAWARIAQLDVRSLGEGDSEGDTQLMILLVSDKEVKEYIYVIVERLLKEDPSYLSLRNQQKQDALFLAATRAPEEPVVASYIAEALIRGKQDVNRTYDGNALLHCLAKRGDTHAKVLERLLQLRTFDSKPIFDVNTINKNGYTPLHIACATHKPEGPCMYETVQSLLENGADCTIQEYIDKNTPLHMLISGSCDVKLIRILLENCNQKSQKQTTIPNRQENTVLHLACQRNTLDLNTHKTVLESLLQHGASIQMKNINARVPSCLVDSARKQEIKYILHGYNKAK